ncbi:hypothetical protein C0992_006416 [Termitomyces sp. T32_za158]|nr:hypothetical protein C0992_006416 [Termitomyces sp. T32_za158]
MVVWHLGEILTLVRDMTQAKCPIPVLKLKNRQEVFTLSPLKRMLAQFETVEEFYGAIIGVLQGQPHINLLNFVTSSSLGIESLQDLEIIHCDISFGNIILDEEIYRETDKVVQWIDVDQEDNRRGRIALVRRERVDIGAIGGLHDLDVAAYIPGTVFPWKSRKPPVSRPPESIAPKAPLFTVKQKPQCDWRTGNMPFISLPLLLGSQDSVYSDLQSLFFVLYLALFTFDKRLPNCFPDAPPPVVHRWPPVFQDWTDSPGSTTKQLSTSKKAFFLGEDDSWYDTVKSDALSLWCTGDGMLKKVHWDMLYTFFQQIWIDEEKNPINKTDVQPSSIRTSLQKTLDSLDMYSEIPVTDIN